jgi:hypothetical protein
MYCGLHFQFHRLIITCEIPLYKIYVTFATNNTRNHLWLLPIGNYIKDYLLLKTNIFATLFLRSYLIRDIFFTGS